MVILGVAFGIVFFAVTTGSPLTGFAYRLGSGDFLYGVLMALPVAGGVFQLVTAYWIERVRKRKAIFMVSLILQRVLWLPIAFVPFLVPSAWPGLRIWVVICLLCLSSISGAVGGVPFLSWMGDLVPDHIRGRYFSRRNTVSTIMASLGGLAAGFFLDLKDNFTGFAVVFSAAALFGVADILCFIWVDEPPMTAGEHVPFLTLLTYPFRDANFRRYMFFWAAWMFGVNLAAPFFNVYMLKHLNLGYLQISLYTQLLGSLATVLFVRMWGRLSDRYGSKPVMGICCAMAGVTPLLWLLPSPAMPRLSLALIVAGINFFGGAFWSGIDVTYLNLLLGCSPERNRSMFVAAFTLFASLVGGALAFLAGGFYLDATRAFVAGLHWRLFGAELTNYHLLFLTTSLLRFAALLLFLPRLRENAAVYSPRQVVKELLRGKIAKKASSEA
ncbi:MAG: MFS transporter [Patescibacteria group bacterium]